MIETEYKFVHLKSLKMTNEGPGTIEGYRAVFDIDEGGDLLIKGAFRDTTPEYLNSGFTAQAHNWDFKEAVGFPLTAREDDHGWFVVSQFHSTPDAQLIRIKAKERMEAGKQVSFSFGYAARDYETITARDYERELPRYVSADRLGYNMAQAKRFSQIRLLKRVDVIEDSIVTAPMNKRAAATGVKFARDRSRVSVPCETALQLRSKSLRLRASAIQTLYGPRDHAEKDYRAESETLRRRVVRTLAGLR